jgi:Ca2+-binding RTX toxin-like protein
MAQPTAREQLMLELVNRARLDPAAEAARLGIALNQGLPAGTIDATSKAPLAMNFLLIDSARSHSQWMLNTDTFSHTGVGGSSPQDRMDDAGYVFNSPSWNGENISWTGSTGAIDLTAAIYAQHDSLFKSSGHRTNILFENFREMGVGQISGQFLANGTNFNASMVTQNFAQSGSKLFLTGVAYNDGDTNNFYSVGEGIANVRISFSGSATRTTTSGGYQLAVPNGVQLVSFDDGNGLARVRATLTGENAKLDYVNSDTILSSVSITLISGVTKATLLGLDNLSLTGSASSDVLTGNKGANTITGGTGNDTIDGAYGHDRLVGGEGSDKLYGDRGNDAIYGQDGNDRLYGDIGNDTLSAGAGVDRLTGGRGADKLYGGDDADLFIFTNIADSTPAASGRDTIYDFSQAELDRVDLSGIDANTASGGNQAFSFIGTGDFTGVAGEVRYQVANGNTTIYADVDGNRSSDLVNTIIGSVALTSSDFVL